MPDYCPGMSRVGLVVLVRLFEGSFAAAMAQIPFSTRRPRQKTTAASSKLHPETHSLQQYNAVSPAIYCMVNQSLLLFLKSSTLHLHVASRLLIPLSKPSFQLPSLGTDHFEVLIKLIK